MKHRGVGVFQQCVRIIPIQRISADPDACTDVQHVSVDLVRQRKMIQYLLGRQRRAFRVILQRHHDNEFVPTLARDRVARAGAVNQLLRH